MYFTVAQMNTELNRYSPARARQRGQRLLSHGALRIASHHAYHVRKRGDLAPCGKTEHIPESLGTRRSAILDHLSVVEDFGTPVSRKDPLFYHYALIFRWINYCKRCRTESVLSSERKRTLSFIETFA
jgi:hypothetical protein